MYTYFILVVIIDVWVGKLIWIICYNNESTNSIAFFKIPQIIYFIWIIKVNTEHNR